MNEVDLLLEKVKEWVDCLRRSGIYFRSEPSERFSNVKETIERPLNKTWGNPKENPRGLPELTIRTRRYTDSLLATLAEVIPELPSEIITKEIEETNYEPVCKKTTSPIYFIPKKSVRKFLQPVLECLNFDKTLIDPGDLGPPLRWYPLGQLDSIMSMCLNLLAYQIITEYGNEPIYWFLMLTDPTFGVAYMADIVRREFGSEKAEWVYRTYNVVVEIVRISSLIKWISQMLKRQIMVNTQYQLLIKLIADPSIAYQYDELMNIEHNIQSLKNICSLYAPRTIEVVTEATVSYYELLGPIGTVNTTKYAITSDGAYAKVSSHTEPVVSQQYIKSLRLFKQVVGTGFKCISDDYDHFRSSHIPCSNWEDVRRLSRMVTMETATKVFRYLTLDPSSFKKKVTAIIHNCPNMVSGNARWNILSGELTLTRTTLQKI